MKHFVKVFFFIFLGLTLITCEKKDITPTYILITKEDISLSLENLDLAQFNSPSGLTAHDFSDIWLTANGKKIGVWELPCKIPILAKGDVTLQLSLGIKLNGMSTTRPIYPFTQKYISNIIAQGGEVIELKPIFKYYNDNAVYFPLVENFESAGTIFSSTDSSISGFTKVNDPEIIYQNENDINDINTCSGLIQLRDSINSFEVMSNLLTLPGGGKSILLEFNYKSDQEIYTGLLVNQSTSIPTQEALVVLKPTNGKWKKTYINLTLAVSRNYTATGFRVILAGNKNNSEIANFYFDNIRVVSSR